MSKTYRLFSFGVTAALAGATTLLVGTTIFVKPASAACKQQFVNTTCSGWGPMQKCTNHFAQVCDGMPVLAPGQGGSTGGALKPGVAMNGGNIVSRDGAGIVSHDAGGFRSR